MTKGCLLTSAGQGAIATVLVRGPRAATIVGSLFQSASGKSIAEEPIGVILFGFWRSTATAREELVVCKTGDDSVEVHCHGGTAATHAVLRSLQEAGCDITSDWREVIPTRSEIEREARTWLMNASTDRTAAILLSQLHGALENELQSLQSTMNRSIDDALGHLDRLLQTVSIGQHLTVPWKVVVTGPPNVGKSSLINAMMGFDRLIVFDRPGTTRDVITVQTTIDGWPIELSDTAGLRTTSNQLEQAGIDRALRQLQNADLIIFVRSPDQEETPPFTRATNRPNQKTITVINKWDLLEEDEDESDQPAVEYDLRTIATTGCGVDQLLDRIANTLVPESPDNDSAIVFTERQTQLLQQLRSDLLKQDIRSASHVIDQIIGPAKS